MTAIKICGVTHVEDAEAAAALGADYVGLNLWPGSRRHVTLAAARAIAMALPAGVLRVGVFVNAAPATIEAAIDELGLDHVQLHGDEDAGFCRRFGARTIRAMRVASAIDLAPFADEAAPLHLLDTASTGYGGSGRTFDWGLARAAAAAGRRFLLAGGLTPDNVGEAVKTVRPFGVDVAGGVESAPGIKNHDKMRRFIAAVREGTEG